MAITFQDIMNYATINKDNYEQLKRQIQHGTVIPFVGAGLSACIYPGWWSALKMLADDIMDLAAKKEILEILSDDYMMKHADALEYAAKRLEVIWTKNVFDQKIYRIFSPEKLEKAEVKEILCKEAVAVLPGVFPQGVILTTNYDHVLEKVYGIYGEGVHSCDVLHQERLNRRLKEMSSGALLIKLHGDVEEASTSVILHRESYDMAYQDGSPLVMVLRKCYGNKSILFLGCSLEHDRTMDELQRTLEPGNIHFTFFPCEDDGTVKQNIVMHMGEKSILPILYPKGQYVCVRLILEQLLMELNLDQYQQLPIKIRENGIRPANLAERLAPETRAAIFYGRDREYDRLLDFGLKRKDRFLWWAITGDGGAGKSRIAYELSTRMREEGWDVFYLKKMNEYLSLDASYRQSGRNVLFILDRVIGYEEQIGSWMEKMYHQPGESSIRILLVERKNENFSQSGWMEQVLFSAEMPGILEECCYDRQMLELCPMKKEDIKRLIISYGDICEEDDSTIDEIMDRLEKIDPDKMRPLYVIMLTEVWKSGKLNQMDTQNKLLGYIWEAEFARYQTYFLEQSSRSPLEAKVRAKAFRELKLAATLVNGLEWDIIHTNFLEAWEGIAEKEDVRKMMISNLEERSAEGISAMEPDLIADYFILREAEKNTETFKQIFISCWETNSIECFIRVNSLLSSFPEQEEFLERIIDMPLNTDGNRRSNIYAMLLSNYALLKNDISVSQQITRKLMELQDKEQDNVGLKYPLAQCISRLCISADTFEEKWKYITMLSALGYSKNTQKSYTVDMMLANMIGGCLVGCYGISMEEQEFQMAEKERKRLLAALRQTNPLYFYVLGTVFGTKLLSFYLEYERISPDLLVDLLKDLLIKIDRDDSVRIIYIENYISGLCIQLDKQAKTRDQKRIWYQIDELYRKGAVQLMEKMEKTKFFLPEVYSIWSFHEKSLELMIRSLYENNRKMVEDTVGEVAQKNAAAHIRQLYLLAMGAFIQSAEDESITDLLCRLKNRFENADEDRKIDEAIIYSRGIMLTYNKYGRLVFDNRIENSDRLMEKFRALEKELKLLEDTFKDEQIHKNWLEVITTSTYMEPDRSVLRKKVDVIRKEYETKKEIEDDDTNLLRGQYSMALNNLCKDENNRSVCIEAIRLQWKLYEESKQDSKEREKILWEAAKTINNTVKTAKSLEECQNYSDEIRRILSMDEIQSIEIKDKILLEYGKSLVNRFICISTEMEEQRKECLKELEVLYLDAKERNSDLKEQFLIRWIYGLNNAAATCGNKKEMQEYLARKERLIANGK